MTRERRRALEARIIAARNTEPEPFTRAGARSAWANDTTDAPRRRVHRSRDTEEQWPSVRKRPL